MNKHTHKPHRQRPGSRPGKAGRIRRGPKADKRVKEFLEWDRGKRVAAKARKRWKAASQRYQRRRAKQELDADIR